jgi:hypothetical protein
MIMQNKELKGIFLAHVSQNRESLEKAVDRYEEGYNVRNDMAEQGMELTPDELKVLTELIRDCLDVLDREIENENSR